MSQQHAHLLTDLLDHSTSLPPSLLRTITAPQNPVPPSSSPLPPVHSALTVLRHLRRDSCPPPQPLAHLFTAHLGQAPLPSLTFASFCQDAEVSQAAAGRGRLRAARAAAQADLAQATRQVDQARQAVNEGTEGDDDDAAAELAAALARVAEVEGQLADLEADLAREEARVAEASSRLGDIPVVLSPADAETLPSTDVTLQPLATVRAVSDATVDRRVGTFIASLQSETVLPPAGAARGAMLLEAKAANLIGLQRRLRRRLELGEATAAAVRAAYATPAGGVARRRASSAAAHSVVLLPEDAARAAASAAAGELDRRAAYAAAGGATEADPFASIRAARDDFLAQLGQHAREMFEESRLEREERGRAARGVATMVSSARKRAVARANREAKERIRALKDNDEEAYERLVKNAKNKRLTDLLEQTDSFLRQIGAMVEMAAQGELGEDEEDSDGGGKKGRGGDGGGSAGGAGGANAGATSSSAVDEDEEGDSSRLRRKAAPKSMAQKAAADEERRQKVARRVAAKRQEEQEREQQASDATAADRLRAEKRNVYSLAHRVEEAVEQPTIMVGGKLKPYQMRGLAWLVSLYNNRLNGILADEMGLGKTIQTISLITYLAEKKGAFGPWLMVVPLSTVDNWLSELTRWAPSVSVVVYRGTPDERKAIFETDIATGRVNVIITTYEFVIRDARYLRRISWFYIVVDEGHRLKNAQSKLMLVFKSDYRAKHRLILTGTPLHNDLSELWSLLNFLLPHIFDSKQSFEQWFNSPFATEDVEPTEEEKLLIINRLHKVLRPFLLRRLKTDVESDLLEKVESVIKCDMSSLQRALYKSMFESSVLLSRELESGKKKRAGKTLMNTLMQLRKVCNHPYLFEEDNWPIDENLVRYSGKVELLDRLLYKLLGSGHRVLIFCQFTSVMDILEDFFRLRNYVHLRLDGSTATAVRAESMRQFNAPDSTAQIFLLSTRAGGFGINLQTADTVILFDSDWNPQNDLQAQARAHRIGQKAEVRVFRMITSGSIEERILERARQKQSMDDLVIQAGKFNQKTTASERRQILEELIAEERERGDAQAGASQAAGGASTRSRRSGKPVDVTGEDELNQILARLTPAEREACEAKNIEPETVDPRTMEEYHLFCRMDRELAEQRNAAWRAQGNTGPAPPVLLPDEELPDWANADVRAAKAKAEEEADPTRFEELGRGARRRDSPVVYFDAFSDKKFERLLESGADSADLEAERQRLVELRLAREERKRRRAEEDDLYSKAVDDDGDEGDADASKANTPMSTSSSAAASRVGSKRKRGRPRKNA